MSFMKKCNRCGAYERHVAKEKTGDEGDYCLGCKRINKPDDVNVATGEGGKNGG
jgi:hypothetical protein